MALLQNCQTQKGSQTNREMRVLCIFFQSWLFLISAQMTRIFKEVALDFGGSAGPQRSTKEEQKVKEARGVFLEFTPEFFSMKREGKSMRLFALIGILFLGLSAAYAQDQANPISVNLEAYLVDTVTQDDGTVEEVFTQSESARPGQLVEYRVLVKNISGELVSSGSSVVTGPVPAGTTFMADSASSSDDLELMFSADGGQTFSMPPVMIMVTNDEGEEEEVEANPEMYTAARWRILKDMSADEELVLVYRVTVN